MNKDDKLPFEALKSMVNASKTKKAVAEDLDITQQYLGDLLKRRRQISDNVAKSLGFEKIIVYTPIEQNK